MCDQYVNLGISVIPIRPATKEPYFSRLRAVGWRDEEGAPIWQPATKAIASQDVLDTWFGDGQASIAMVAGKVSGNLVYLDWDDAMAYRRWALDHKRLVNSTSVSKTAAGYHVFFRVPEAVGGNMYYKDAHAGHIRGEGMYVVAAPSYHPSGIQYQWLRHPSLGVAEIEDLATIGIRAPTPSKLPDEYMTEPVSMTDEVILIKASSAPWCRDVFMLLWRGKWHEPLSDRGRQRYPSQSEADLALCRILAYWTGRDAIRIDTIFRRSRLFRRSKWDTVHFSTSGETYGERTIAMACLSTNKVYEVRLKHQNKWRKI